MGECKKLIVKPISAQDANRLIKKIHYSHKVVPNSQLHFGVFYKGRCGGAIQYGPSINKKATINLVEGTGWNEFLELNRMALADWLPPNGESRCIAYTLRFIKKHYPHIKWIISFADATQCGDGSIYRATGFCLTDVKVNTSLRVNPETGKPEHTITAYHKKMEKEFRTWDPLKGYQIRYIYFLDPAYKEKLTVPILPYSILDKMDVRMYRGEYVRPSGVNGNTSSLQEEDGGSIPTEGLNIKPHTKKPPKKETTRKGKTHGR